jgi:gliding motility-associated lipoprotein GldH
MDRIKEKTKDFMIKETGHNLPLSLLLLFMLLTAGCGRDTIYTDSVPMPSETWTLSDAAEFSPEINDTSSLNNIFFTIRTGSSYPFQNIWLFISTSSPSGKIISDTLEYNLADEKGEWYGRGFGDIHELRLPFRNAVYFPEKGQYTFQVRHGMRAENLKGVYDFGLRIEKLKN